MRAKIPYNETKQQVLKILQSCAEPVFADQLANLCQLTSVYVRRILRELQKQGNCAATLQINAKPSTRPKLLWKSIKPQ